MTQQDQSEHATSDSNQTRPIGGFSRAIADILVHRPVLTHLIATILPDAEKARLRALVGPTWIARASLVHRHRRPGRCVTTPTACSTR
jgi:hypothetical protein